MKQMYRYGWVIFIVIAGVVLQGCNRMRQKEARFLHDYRTVSDLARIMKQQAPKGFELEFKDPASQSFAMMEQNVRDYMHSSGGWWGDGYYESVFRPASIQSNVTNAPLDAGALLKQYFGDLERLGFSSGEIGFVTKTSLASMEVANKSWYNPDRTLIVFGQIIKDRKSGEIIASISYSGTLNYRAR
jgi:hypothetical protein